MSLVEAFVKNYKSIREMEENLRTNEDCIAYLEELIWEGFPISPFDETSKVYKCKDGRYKCKNTNRYFNVLTGTIFENTKLPLIMWFKAMFYLIANRCGVSSTALAEMLGVTQATAWNMLQKIRKCMSFENNHQLKGVVEADEFIEGGLLKNMHYDKKLEVKAKGGYYNKVPLHGMVERNGNAVINHVPNTEADTLNAKILKHVAIGSTLYTDENQGYKNLSDFFQHNFVVHSKGNYAVGIVNTNSIESVWATFGRMFSRYIHMSIKHLQNYANECVFRYNTRKMEKFDACVWLLQNVMQTRITRKELALGYQ